MALTQPLVKKYQPRKIQDFVGLDDVKKALTRFVANPYNRAFLFRGKPGLGKTSMALALAREIAGGVDFIHTDSNGCNIEWITRVQTYWQFPTRYDTDQVFRPFAPLADRVKWFFYLVDEVDEITHAAYIKLLTVLQNLPPNVIFVFTANLPEKDEDDKLEKRFIERCMTLKFSNYGAQAALVDFLKKVWAEEAPTGATPPNFAQIATDAKGSVRSALTDLELQLLSL